ncbi:MAG: hypothetical protein ACP5EK_03150, partial [Thermoplasmatota archaeon]
MDDIMSPIADTMAPTTSAHIAIRINPAKIIPSVAGSPAINPLIFARKRDAMAIKSVIVSTNRIYSNIPIRLNNVTEFRLKPLWECPSEHFEQRSYAPQQVGVPAYSFGFLGLF